jgi:hypothetical protein
MSNIFLPGKIYMKACFLTIFLIGAALAVSAPQTDFAGTLWKTESGNRVLALFAAFNAGDEEKLKNFFPENGAADQRLGRRQRAFARSRADRSDDYRFVELPPRRAPKKPACRFAIGQNRSSNNSIKIT